MITSIRSSIVEFTDGLDIRGNLIPHGVVNDSRSPSATVVEVTDMQAAGFSHVAVPCAPK